MEKRSRRIDVLIMLSIFSVLMAIGGCNSGKDMLASRTGVIPEAGLQKPTTGIVIDHSCTKLDRIPEQWIHAAKANLHIAYGHTSHGSQLVTGMEGLVRFKGPLYAFNKGGTGGALDLRDTPFSESYMDLGYPDRTKWKRKRESISNLTLK